MTAREKLHRLADELPDEEVEAAELFLTYLRDGRSDPLLLALATAPWDDEPETPEEAAAVEEARQELARAEATLWEDVRKHLPRQPENSVNTVG